MGGLNFEIAEWCKKTELEVRFKKWAPQQKIQDLTMVVDVPSARHTPARSV